MSEIVERLEAIEERMLDSVCPHNIQDDLLRSKVEEIILPIYNMIGILKRAISREAKNA